MYPRGFAETVPSAWWNLLAVVRLICKPAEALSPEGTEPRQLRGLVSGGSLQVGQGWVQLLWAEGEMLPSLEQYHLRIGSARTGSAEGGPGLLSFSRTSCSSASSCYRRNHVMSLSVQPNLLRVGSLFMSCAGGNRRCCAEGQAEGATRTDGG